jgi:hypothetical protein
VEDVEMRIERWSAVLAVTLLAAILAGCGDRNAPEAEAQKKAEAEKALILSRDSAIAEDIASNRTAEARAWLKDDNHVIFEGNKAEVAKLVEDLYTAGAKEVYITGIVDIEGAQLSASLAVVLPDDPAARKRVFDIQRALYKSWEYEEGATEDIGQKYMDFTFD